MRASNVDHGSTVGRFFDFVFFAFDFFAFVFAFFAFDFFDFAFVVVVCVVCVVACFVNAFADPFNFNSNPFSNSFSTAFAAARSLPITIRLAAAIAILYSLCACSAFAASSVPMVPLAPARLSTRTC